MAKKSGIRYFSGYPHIKKVNNPLPKICIVAGVPRAASTFLYHFLGNHPGVFKPFRKETNFFLTNYRRGGDWYLSLYKGIGSNQTALDVSPSYVFDKSSVKRIKAYSAPKKIILVVRRPEQFALSWYKQQLTHFKEFISFDDFMKGWTAKRGDGQLYTSLVSGAYHKGIDLYRLTFGKELLIYKYEDMRDDPLLFLQRLETFLQIRAYYNRSTFKNRIINAADRRNNRFITYLLSREWMISMFEKIPRNVTLVAREMFDSISKPVVINKRDERDQVWLDKAAALLNKDIEYYNNLFEKRTYLYGENDRSNVQKRTLE